LDDDVKKEVEDSRARHASGICMPVVVPYLFIAEGRCRRKSQVDTAMEELDSNDGGMVKIGEMQHKPW
jgi:hypothetical protein